MLVACICSPPNWHRLQLTHTACLPSAHFLPQHDPAVTSASSASVQHLPHIVQAKLLVDTASSAAEFVYGVIGTPQDIGGRPCASAGCWAALQHVLCRCCCDGQRGTQREGCLLACDLQLCSFTDKLARNDIPFTKSAIQDGAWCTAVVSLPGRRRCVSCNP
jgi:hypothetical protein